MVLDGEEHEAVRILFQEGLRERPLSLRVVRVLLGLHDLLGRLVAHLRLMLRHRELNLRLREVLLECVIVRLLLLLL